MEAQDTDFARAGDSLLVALGAIGRSLGVKITVPSFKTISPSVETLEAIAQASGIRTRRVLLTTDWWRQSQSPLLGFLLPDNQPVALLPSGRTYEILNPLSRQRTLLTAQTAQNLTPIAYMFYPTLPEEIITLRGLWQFALKGCNRELAQAIVVGVMAVLLGMLTPQAFGLIIDYAIPNTNRGLLAQISLGLFAASFGLAMFQLAQNIAILRLRTHVLSKTQAAIWDRLLKLPVSELRPYPIGALYDRISVVGQMGERLSNLTIQLVFGGVLSLLYLGLLLIYSPTLTVIAIATIASASSVVLGAVYFLQPLMAEQQRFKANSLAFALQLTRGIGQLRIAAAEERAFGFWERQYNQQLKLILAQQILQDRSRLFQQIIPTLGLIALLGWGIPLVQSSLPLGSRPLSTGTFLAFYVAFGALMGGVVSLGNNILDGLGAVALWQQVKPLFSLRPEIYSSQSDPGKLRGYLKFDQVSFRYDSGRALVLNRVTLEAQPGEFVAIVGTPGSGKSTLVRLLLGFEVPESGAIYYDGQDLSRLNPATVRSQLGVVLQHGRIYQGTILENIAGRTLASMDEVWAAASMAGLVDEINRMPMGLHTVVSEGGINLSGGLQQQLLIARALVSQPQIIIFDEATNSLDYRTQQIVARSLEQLKITRIVIAHHASVIRNADRIYLLDGGHVVQQGHFTELMQEQELFRKMFKNMFKDQVSDSAGETEP